MKSTKSINAKSLSPIKERKKLNYTALEKETNKLDRFM